MEVRISRIFTGFLRICLAPIRENPVKIREIRISINPIYFCPLLRKKRLKMIILPQIIIKNKKLKKNIKIKPQLLKTETAQVKAERLRAEKERQSDLGKTAKEADLQEQLAMFKKFKLREDTDEEIMQFMEINQKTFQQYIKWIENQ
jgi:hypothetical protein